MVPRGKTLGDLVHEVLDERAAAVTFTTAETDAAARRLRERFAAMRAVAAARRHVAAAVATLPPHRRAGWLSGAQAALGIVLGEARRGSRIIAEAARDLLPRAPDAWMFEPGALAATRGGAVDARRADSDLASGMPPLSITLDDSGDLRRVIATIREFPADRPPPVLLIIADTSEDDHGAMPDATEVAAEILPERGTDIDAARQRLRYEAVLPPGRYSIFLGNPRMADDTA